MAAGPLPRVLLAAREKASARLCPGFDQSGQTCRYAQQLGWCSSGSIRLIPSCGVSDRCSEGSNSVHTGRQSPSRCSTSNLRRTCMNIGRPYETPEVSSYGGGKKHRIFYTCIHTHSSPQLAASSAPATTTPAADAAAKCKGEKGKAGRRQWRWLLPIGGGSMFVGWYAERLQEELRDMYTAESVLCVNVLEGDARDMCSSQLLQRYQHTSSGDSNCRSCLSSSNNNTGSDGYVRSPRDRHSEAWHISDSSTTSTAREGLRSSSFQRRASGTGENEVDPTPEQVISRWQDFACRRPGFISSRVYVHRNSWSRSGATAVSATPKGQDQQQRVEHRRYLILDRWTTKSAADAALRELESSEVSATTGGSSALQQNQGSGCPQVQQQSNIWRQSQKGDRLGQEQGRAWGDQQATYVFDSRQTASLWRALC